MTNIWLKQIFFTLNKAKIILMNIRIKYFRQECGECVAIDVVS